MNGMTKNFFESNQTSYDDFDDLRIISNSYIECENCRLIFASIWIVLIFTGLLGNGLVVFTIIKFNKLTNVTQCYLFNLACADLAFIISCIPLTTLSYLIENWIFGNFLCKAYHYASFVTVCATCLTLMMMTIDRCNYVCNTRKQSWRNSGFVFYITCLIWLISFILSIPNLITYNVQPLVYYLNKNSTNLSNSNEFQSIFNNSSYEIVEECVQKRDFFLSNVTQWYSTIVSYLIPSFVLVVSYIKILHFMTVKTKNLALTSTYNSKISVFRKKRVTKIVIFLTLNFIVLWFPVHFLATWYRLDSEFPEHLFSFYYLKMIAHTMSYANSSVNPIIYAFSNESFRHSIIHLFRKLLRREGSDEFMPVPNRVVKSNEITQFL
ncbi:unnamed protein product [Brachionus calyciflorus]|uniref:G-protein coupled receptors family 1 profile domain-containing protein n=1 Tax=Brachionus calyciflorus TaxID=104777 RepID=A0A813NH58_9BILA|nr:unnamed protein product [Brachionus calyciflorus]